MILGSVMLDFHCASGTISESDRLFAPIQAQLSLSKGSRPVRRKEPMRGQGWSERQTGRKKKQQKRVWWTGNSRTRQPGPERKEAHNNATRSGDKGAAKRMAPLLGIPYPVIKKKCTDEFFPFFVFCDRDVGGRGIFSSIEIIPNQ